MATQQKTVAWWAQTPVTPFGTPTNITLGTGAQDVEKGNIYAVPAGTPVTLPVAGKIAWEDAQHVVVQTASGVVNLLHVNPTAPTGTAVAPGQEFATVSPVVGSVTAPSSGITYTETGNIIEAGLYSTVQGAINRENFVNGADAPYDFSGIMNPTSTFQSWTSQPDPTTPSAAQQAGLSVPSLAQSTNGTTTLQSSTPTTIVPTSSSQSQLTSQFVSATSHLPGQPWMYLVGGIIIAGIIIVRG